jgi:hypothetical protein
MAQPYYANALQPKGMLYIELTQSFSLSATKAPSDEITERA